MFSGQMMGLTTSSTDRSTDPTMNPTVAAQDLAHLKDWLED